MESPFLQIGPEPVDLGSLVQTVTDPGAGAVVVFAGTTRNETGGREVKSLDYEAYGEMAAKELHRIAKRALARFAVAKIAVAHRLGTLVVGEISVGIAVSAPHRPAAFDACRSVIEAIKRDVPIWKRETFADGSAKWVHPSKSG